MEIINYLKKINGSGYFVEHVGWHESGDYLLRGLFSESDNTYRAHKYDTDKEYEIVSIDEVNKLERQTCGENLKSETDYWRILNNGDRICSSCGSLHPNDVLEIIKKHGKKAIEYSTKSYKWYINRPEVKNAGDGGIKYYRQHDTQEFIDGLNLIIKNEQL